MTLHEPCLYLNCSKHLVLYVSPSKFLLHRCSGGGIQHLQPDLWKEGESKHSQREVVGLESITFIQEAPDVLSLPPAQRWLQHCLPKV